MLLLGKHKKKLEIQQECSRTLHFYVGFPLEITLRQGGRSWQALGERKKCLQFFRRARIFRRTLSYI